MPKRVEYEAILEDGRYRRTLTGLQASSSRLGLGPGLRQAEGPLNTIVAGVGRLGPLAIGAGAAFTGIVASINKALSSYAAFETSLARVAATTGNTLASIRSDYGVLIQDIARQTGIATDEIASGVQKAISGGITDSREVGLIVQQAARFAAAGFGELATAISATTTVFANFRDAGLSTAEVMDAIAISAQFGEGEVADFSPAFKRLSGTARLLNIEVGELGAIIANISQTAPSVSEGVTQLEGVMKLLIKPSQQAREALEGIGLSVEDLQQQIADRRFADVLEQLQDAIAEVGPELAGTLFRDFQGVLGQQNLDADTIRAFTGRIERGMGQAIDAAFDETSNTIDAQMNRLGQTWETRWQEIGSRATSALEVSGFIDALEELVDDSLNILDEAVRYFSTRYRQAAEDQELNVRVRARIDFADEARFRQRLAAAVRPEAPISLVGGLDAGIAQANANLAEQRQIIEDIRKEEEERGQFLEIRFSPINQAALRGARRELDLEKRILTELNKRRDAAVDVESTAGDVTEQTAMQVMLLASSREHIDNINRGLQTEEERLQAAVDATQALIDAEIARNRNVDVSELVALKAREQKALDDFNDERQANEDAAAERRAESARRAEEQEQRRIQSAALDRIDLERRLLDSRTGPADSASAAGFQMQREFIARDLALSFRAIETLYGDNQERLAAEREIVLNDYFQGVKDINDRAAQAVADATQLYTDSFVGLGQSIGDAFQRFEDSTEGWIELLLNGLPQIIGQFQQLRTATEGLGALGGSTGGGGFLSLLGGFFGGFRAEGGPVSARQGYLVGERGVEYFQPGQSGRIIPNDQLGGTMNLTVNFPSLDLSGDIRAQINASVPQIATAGQAFLRRARIEGPR